MRKVLGGGMLAAIVWIAIGAVLGNMYATEPSRTLTPSRVITPAKAAPQADPGDAGTSRDKEGRRVYKVPVDWCPREDSCFPDYANGRWKIVEGSREVGLGDVQPVASRKAVPQNALSRDLNHVRIWRKPPARWLGATMHTSKGHIKITKRCAIVLQNDMTIAVCPAGLGTT